MNNITVTKAYKTSTMKTYSCNQAGIGEFETGIGRLSIETSFNRINGKRTWVFTVYGDDAFTPTHTGKPTNHFIVAYNEMISYLKSEIEKKQKPTQKRRTIAVESLERLADAEQSDRILHSLLFRNDYRNPSFSWDWYEEMRDKVRSNLRMAVVDARITLKIQLERS